METFREEPDDARKLAAALFDPVIARDPTDDEIRAWLTAPLSLDDDDKAALARAGSPFAREEDRRAVESMREADLVSAMNRANPSDSLSAQTRNELARLREKLLRK